MKIQFPFSLEKGVAIIFLMVYLAAVIWTLNMGSGANDLLHNNARIVDAHNAGIRPDIKPGHAFDAIWMMLGMTVVLLLSPMAVKQAAVVLDPNA